MHTQIMKWVSIAALILMGLGLPIGTYRVGLEIVVCVSALLIVTQAIRSRKYIWAVGFMLVALFFNPVVPLLFLGNASLLLNWVCLTGFVVSLVTLKTQPTLSILSITSQSQRTESL